MDPRHAYAVGDDDQKGLGEQNFGHMREPCRVRGEEKRGKAYISEWKRRMVRFMCIWKSMLMLGMTRRELKNLLCRATQLLMRSRVIVTMVTLYMVRAAKRKGSIAPVMTPASTIESATSYDCTPPFAI